LGADDYVTKPFDIEELRLRVQNGISRAERESLTDPQSGLPTGRLIEEQLRRIIRLKDWAFLDIKINNFEPFKNVYGFIAANNVLRFTGMLLGDVIDEHGNPDDFLGHAGNDNFVVITSESTVEKIVRKLKDRFIEKVSAHYNFMDSQQGFLSAPDGSDNVQKYPLMTLSVGVVTPSRFEFSDIREITELAAEERRKDVVVS
jgi:GGDEF domain-containing protein